MQWAVSFVAVSLSWFLWNALSLIHYYLRARKSGLPIFLSPVNPDNPLWQIFSVPLRPLFRKHCPSWLYDRLKISIHGWEFAEKSDHYFRFARTFITPHPGGINVFIADPEIAWEVLSRRNDFKQLPLSSKFIGLFGSNLLVADGDVWQRQRKVIAPSLNERISSVVWDESSRQAREMLDYFLGQEKGETIEAIDGVRRIAIHVLGQAGYGMPQPWKQEDKGVEVGQQPTYIEAVSIYVYNLILGAVLPAWVMRLRFMSEEVQVLGQVKDELPNYTRQMLEEERKRLSSDGKKRHDMMSMLVQLSNQAKRGEILDQKGQYLSEDEIIGNMFLFSAAGFDTTANTLGYGVTMLAARQDIQDWLIEELDAVLKMDNQVLDDDYNKIFPLLSRCLAFMLETLRMYTPLHHLSRHATTDQVLKRGEDTFVIPAGSTVYLSSPAMHIDPDSWGVDATSFRPSRWLNEQTGKEQSPLINMPKGTFTAWSGGPRVCPGQKMAQVEFVAVIATLVRTCRILPVLGDGEDLSAGSRRLIAAMQDSESRLTLQMKRPKDIKLRFVKR